MTALAGLGIVADAPALLAELAARLGVPRIGASGETRDRTTAAPDNREAVPGEPPRRTAVPPDDREGAAG
jgi:hypothetical protein